VGPLIRLGQTVQKHAEVIRNYYRYRITTAPPESFNSRLKVLTGRARGYRDMDNFKRMIIALREFNPLLLFS
jgi:transposase